MSRHVIFSLLIALIIENCSTMSLLGKFFLAANYRKVDIYLPLATSGWSFEKTAVYKSNLFRKFYTKVKGIETSVEEKNSNQEPSAILLTNLNMKHSFGFLQNPAVCLENPCWIFSFPGSIPTFPMTNIGQQIYYIYREQSKINEITATEAYEINEVKISHSEVLEFKKYSIWQFASNFSNRRSDLKGATLKILGMPERGLLNALEVKQESGQDVYKEILKTNGYYVNIIETIIFALNGTIKYYMRNDRVYGTFYANKVRPSN